MTKEMLNPLKVLFFNFIVVEAFPVFTFDGFLHHSETPSFASFVGNIKLPDKFIVCSSSKEATFNQVGLYTILGEDSKDWLTLIIWPFWGEVWVTVYWDGGYHFHTGGDLENPKLDHWYHICLKLDLSKTQIEFAINGVVLGKAIGQNITNVPDKLRMNIGVGRDNIQFHGSVANIQVFKDGDIREISDEPCKKREGTLLPWNPQLWKVEGSHWLLTEEYKETICAPYEHYNLAIPSLINIDEGIDMCKEKLNNSIVPYPENHSTFLKYVDWHKNTTGDACSHVWTPLSDKNHEGLFLNMNDNSTMQYQIWDKSQPNGDKNENYVAIVIDTAHIKDVEGNMLYCSTCSLSTSLILQLDGLCESSFIGNHNSGEALSLTADGRAKL